jgi:hypothetical protein
MQVANLQEKEKHGDMEIFVALMEIYNLIRNKEALESFHDT